jgi:hypothetical protein
MSDESLKFKAIQFMYRFKVEFAKTYMNGMILIQVIQILVKN